MVKHRLYVGNLSAAITDDDLRSKFTHFGTIEDLELKVKNDSRFAFISVDFEREEQAKEGNFTET